MQTRDHLHSYGQNFPAARHSRLSASLAEHELAAEAQSLFSLLPDALMLNIVCSCDQVLPSSPRLASVASVLL
jgi:hypothetical protein